MKADVVLVVKVDVSQASAVIERMQQVLADEFGVPAPEHEHSWVTALDGNNKPVGYLHCGSCGTPREEALSGVKVPEEDSLWKNKDSSNAIWRVTSSRLSRVHAEVFMGSGPLEGWTGTAAEFLNEFRPVPKVPAIGSEWRRLGMRGLWRVVPRLPNADRRNPVRVEQVGGDKAWTGLVAEFNHLFTEATG